MAFSFSRQLKGGQDGEELFHKFHPHWNRRSGLSADFGTETGLTLELKSDYYDMNIGNFFMERWSNVEKKRPGGPWQALDKDIDVFVYWWPKDLVAYWFSTVMLVKELEKLEPKLKPVCVPNKGYTTVGYKVPRELLKEFYVREDYNERPE